MLLFTIYNLLMYILIIILEQDRGAMEIGRGVKSLPGSSFPLPMINQPSKLTHTPHTHAGTHTRTHRRNADVSFPVMWTQPAVDPERCLQHSFV